MSVHVQASPLRYPGGKQVLAKALAAFLEANGLEGCVYAEPYAGGAGAALSLLFSEHVHSILLNDADGSIVALWTSILARTEEFLRLIRDTPLTIDEWQRQRRIYRAPHRHSNLRLGFATFYLNRTNRSGIINSGGAIGGLAQLGKWKLDARFGRGELMRRVSRIALYKERIFVTGMDALDFMKRKLKGGHDINCRRRFVYLDPPYYQKGRELYMNHYSPEDHKCLAAYLLEKREFQWLLTYDRVPAITRLYKRAKQIPFNLPYSAYDRRSGREVLVVGPALKVPATWKRDIELR